MDSKETYRYHALNSYTIRLLEFSTKHDEELAFKIHEKRLDSVANSYIALSYRWGSPANSAYVTVDDSFLAITQNLRDALLQIKHRFAKMWLTNLLWVDAICINQSDKEEKGSQVSMMQQIFDQAHRVYVWLGVPENEENDRNVGLAIAKLKYVFDVVISSRMDTRGHRPWWWPRERSSMRRDNLALSDRVYKNLNKIFDVEGTDAHAAWKGIVELWQNEWWTRAWVAQEATVKEPYMFYAYAGMKVHKKHKIAFLYGRHATSWVELFNSIPVAQLLLKMPLLANSTGMLKGSFTHIARMHSIRTHRLLDREIDLLDALQLTRLSGASNPRDKVYANLSIASKSSASLIRPDYHMSVLETYLEVVQVELEQPVPTLNFLGHAIKLDEPRRTPSPEISFDSWPSWIPNWDDPLTIFPLPKKLYKPSARDGGRRIILYDRPELLDEPVVTGRAYDATRGERVTAFISSYGLHIKGAVIDTVAERYSYQQGTVGERREIINRWYSQQNKLYPNGEDFNKGLLSVQVADVRRDHNGHAIARGNTLNNELNNKRHADLTPEEETAQAEMRMCLDRATTYRGLCLTNRGYIGLVPWSAKAGDCICILLGGQVLYVLRPRKQGAHIYDYIGECCVYALMDGEALDWVHQGNSTIEDFVLV